MTKMGAVPPARPPFEPAPGVAVGGVIAGKYRVNGVIGRGGMGVVVEATQLALERTVAIKVIRGEWAEDAQAVARLLREARAAASIKSEHVARVLDVGTLESGAPFIVMEHLEGVDLDTLLTQGGALPVPSAVDFILQACEAVAEAHRNGIVHRDLKPANLFLARRPGGASIIKVVDFGISKSIGAPALESLTDPSRVVGSLYHMAPEQMRGLPVDARTDVWAIGVVLFELLTGRKPFLEGAWPAVCAQVLNENAPPLGVIGPSVPEELDAIVQRCLRRVASERFANVAELAVALSAFGTRVARSSLEQIVRLATSTGSLSAGTLTPPPPSPAGTREVSSVEPVADAALAHGEQPEATVVAASPPRAAPAPRASAAPASRASASPSSSAPRDRRWRVVVTAAVAAVALALWLAPDGESATRVPRTTIEQLAPLPAPPSAPEPVSTTTTPSPEPAGSATSAPEPSPEPVSSATSAPEPSATGIAPSPAPTAPATATSGISLAPASPAPQPTAAASSAPPVAPAAAAPATASVAASASTPGAAEPAPSAAPVASASAEPAPSDRVSAPPAPVAVPKTGPGSAWDLSDLEFKELPE